MVAPRPSQRLASSTLVAAEVDRVAKRATWASATFHIVTAMVGAGVLAMPRALGALGWVAGPLCVFAFFAVSVLASWLLADLYEVDGVQYPRYFEAVAGILGRRAEVLAATFQLTNIVLVCIAFTITAAMSMTAVADLICDLPPPEVHVHGEEGCFNQQWKYSLMFGAIQIILVQLPSVESSWLVSAVGAVVAMFYILIALGLGIGKVVDGAKHGSVSGISFDSSAAKAFEVLNALGTIGFAYGFSQVFLEVQHTIREPPQAKVSMRRAATVALTIGFVGYLAVSVAGYLAFGDGIPENILTAFNGPKWLVIVAQFSVLVSMIASYSLFAQTLFLTLEGWVFYRLGILRPAEEAALRAAAYAVAAGSNRRAACKLEACRDARLARAAEEGQAGCPSGPGCEPAQAEQGSDGKLEAEVPSQQLSRRASQQLSRRASAGRRGPQDPAAAPAGAPPGGEASGWGLCVEASAAERSGSFIHPQASAGEDRTACCNSRVCSVGGPNRRGAGLRGTEAKKGKSGISVAKRSWRMVLLSVAIRGSYVVLTTVIAVLVPFFGAIVGLIGSLIFWPLAIFFPFTMYKKAYRPPRHIVRFLDTVLIVMLLVSLGAVVGSVRNIIVSWENFSLFD